MYILLDTYTLSQIHILTTISPSFAFVSLLLSGQRPLLPHHSSPYHYEIAVSNENSPKPTGNFLFLAALLCTPKIIWVIHMGGKGLGKREHI